MSRFVDVSPARRTSDRGPDPCCPGDEARTLTAVAATCVREIEATSFVRRRRCRAGGRGDLMPSVHALRRDRFSGSWLSRQRRRAGHRRGTGRSIEYVVVAPPTGTAARTRASPRRKRPQVARDRRDRPRQRESQSRSSSPPRGMPVRRSTSPQRVSRTSSAGSRQRPDRLAIADTIGISMPRRSAN